LAVLYRSPRGDTAREFLERVPESRAGDAIHVNPADKEFSPALNPFDAPYAEPSTNADNIVAAFRARFGESWGPSLERLFLFSTMALVECQDATLLSIPKLFHDERYRTYVLKAVSNPLVRVFLGRRIPDVERPQSRYAARPGAQQNRARAHVSRCDVHLRPAARQAEHAHHHGRAADPYHYLSKGALGVAGSLLGSFTVSLIAQAALSREDTAPGLRKPFHLYVDEFQNAVTDSFDDIASEARKYGLPLTLAHQFFGPVPERARKSALANCKNLISFNVGADDAPLIAEQLGWPNTDTLMELPDYSVMARLHQHEEGKPSRSSSVLQIALDRLPPIGISHMASIIRRSQNEHSRPRAVVEERIEKFLAPQAVKQSGKKGRRRAEHRTETDPWG
jgi:hypothetical protein